ncbi:DUF1266 domain-containing protein [Thaumasiovibrio subtropicus]|uniref:DUF1266 domain-containing protein n=1 Tax=Thaumasiovibrio subtropicus TaxID=1891207 RepID=UPI000B35A862|nr:DUF1266 domain-containing protein [Thaumasiovibrio subtropicus]
MNPKYIDTRPQEIRRGLALTAPLFGILDPSIYDIPRVDDKNETREYNLQALSKWWGITEKSKLVAMIQRLTVGDAHGYCIDHLFKMRACLTPTEWKQKLETTEDSNKLNELHFINLVWQGVGAPQLLAWDVARGAMLVRTGYMGDLLNKEEALFLWRDIACQTQHAFSNWQQYFNSFQCGSNWYSHGDNEEDNRGLLNHNEHWFKEDTRHCYAQKLQAFIKEIPWSMHIKNIPMPESLTPFLNANSIAE